MGYLFLKLWPYLLMAFILGLVWGYSMCTGRRGSEDA